MLYQKYKPLASRVYCAGLALLLVLSEVFSSNLQSTLPTFSRVARLGLTGFAVLLLAGKIVLLTEYETQLQKIIVAVVLVYTAFSAWYGGDQWFFLAALVGLGAKDVDLQTALRVYLATAVAGLLLVQALHFVTPLMPYNFYCQLGFRLRPLQRFRCAVGGRVLCLGLAAARPDESFRLGRAGRAGDFYLQSTRQPGRVRRYGRAVRAVSGAEISAEAV